MLNDDKHHYYAFGKPIQDLTKEEKKEDDTEVRLLTSLHRTMPMLLRKDDDPEATHAKLLQYIIANQFNYSTFKNERLFISQLSRKPTQSIVVIDNFYSNPMQIRECVLNTAFFSVFGNFPGFRTPSFATEELKSTIQQYLRDEITYFPTPENPGGQRDVYNGAFQIATSRDRSWLHNDFHNNWAGILYLNPFPPPSSGTNFYKFHDSTSCVDDQIVLGNKLQTDAASQDMTKWTLVDTIGNVFNRLVLFDSKRFHMSADYFGTNVEDGRLFQVFFFDTKPRL